MEALWFGENTVYLVYYVSLILLDIMCVTGEANPYERCFE